MNTETKKLIETIVDASSHSDSRTSKSKMDIKSQRDN